MITHRFLDTPLGLEQRFSVDLLERIQTDLRQHFEGKIEVATPTIPIPGRPYDLDRGVAVVPVTGVLVNGEAGWSNETSYSSIAAAYIAACDDKDVRAIAMQISSPGGEVSGLFDLCDTIREVKNKKMTWAICDDHAYSAAYAIASSADRICVPRTGGTGSLGVVTMHLDITKLLEEMGVKVSLITYGARKADLSMFQALSDDARSRLQEQVDAIGEMFVDLVAGNRGMSKARVRATEAGTYMGEAGVEAGLAYAVLSPQAAFEQLGAKVS